MSSVSPTTPQTPIPTADTVRALAVRPIRFVAFWTGVLAPLAYLPLIVGQQDGVLLAGVVLANVLGLLLGRHYGEHA